MIYLGIPNPILGIHFIPFLPKKSAKSFPPESSELVERNWKDAPPRKNVWGPLKEDMSWNCVEVWTKNHQTIPNLHIDFGGETYTHLLPRKIFFQLHQKMEKFVSIILVGVGISLWENMVTPFNCWVWNLGAAQAAMATFWIPTTLFVVTGCDRVKRREVRSIQCLMWQNVNMGVSKNRGGPQNGWWKQWKILLKWDDLGVPLFLETPTSVWRGVSH